MILSTVHSSYDDYSGYKVLSVSHDISVLHEVSDGRTGTKKKPFTKSLHHAREI